MLTTFPKRYSDKAVSVYFIALIAVSVIFMSHTLSFKFMLIGSIEVVAFFMLSNRLTQEWAKLPQKRFLNKLFLIALTIRVVWVIFSYYFYIANTGLPFEWSAGDAQMYHEETVWMARDGWKAMRGFLFGSFMANSDSGYFFWLFLVYSVFGPSIIAARIVKALLSAFTCVLIYNLAKRNFGESTGRMSAIFCMLMPNLIIYCGLHLKETEMLFLTVAFLERADYLIRSKHYTVWTIAAPLLLAGSLFFFRTVLGTVTVFSFFTALLFTSEKTIKKGKKVLLIVWGLVAVAYMAGGTIMTEIESTWDDRENNQDAKRQMQINKGVDWAKYAKSGVMAPMIFVVPFATMVDVDEQYNQQLIHGGNYVKNVMGAFVLIALFYSIFKKKNWRDFSLIGAFTIGYLGVIAMSAYANAERFHFPALPCLLMMAAYGVSLVDKKNYKLVDYWFIIVFVMEFAWAYFKLGSRGII